MTASEQTFCAVGAEYAPCLAAHALAAFHDVLAPFGRDGPGERLNGVEGLERLLSGDTAVAAPAARHLGPGARPVRAILFDKSPGVNWGVGWHQDRVIAVRERLDVAGFGPWSIKRGTPHVAPPFDLLANMVTMRIHLDDVAIDNGPLIVALGSHRAGFVGESEIASVVARYPRRTCLARAGDVWIYSTPILHMSKSAASPTRRRVLHVDYCALPLPCGLEWAGI